MQRKYLIMAACLAAVPAAASAAVIVVRSSGPSARIFPAGKALADSQSFALKSNDVVVLLDSRGTRTLRGPGRFNATATANISVGGVRGAVTAITAQNSDRRARVGAVRGVPTAAATGRNIWQADVNRSGTICYADPADLTLYRDRAIAPASINVTNVVSGQSAAVAFPGTGQTARWPSAVPIAAGGRYRLDVGGGASTSLTMRSIAPVPAGLEGLAQSLIRNDCQAQLDVLIDTVAVPSAG